MHKSSFIRVVLGYPVVRAEWYPPFFTGDNFLYWAL
jgi:hypothetical protein